MSKPVEYGLYRLLADSNNPIVLSVIIGYVQAGSTIVKVNDKIIADKSGSFTIKLGTSNELNKAEIRTVSSIEDIQSDVEKVAATVILSGGVEEKGWPLWTSSKDNEVYMLTSTIGLSK